MSQKKVLIITYYWPPSGGGGVQRWLKFAKYLPDFGWQPIVFTPENPEFDLKDESLSKDVSSELEVLRFPIWEPFGVYKKLFKKKEKLKQGIVIEKTNMSFVDRLSVWVRANLFIPDPRRFWVNPSVKFLVPYIEQHNIDAVVTTGPPHSMHLIGLQLKRKCDIKWIADFRDPWSDWDVLDKLDVNPLVRKIHAKLEKSVLSNADLTLTVSKRLALSLKEKSESCRIKIITNGVDEDDLNLKSELKVDSKFRITHMGLLNEVRDPQILWKTLEDLCFEIKGFKEDLEILLAGMVSDSILDRLKNSEELSGCLRHLDYISHQEVFGYYQNSTVLLLLLNQSENAKWILPGKLFEYLLTKKPILTLGEIESDVGDVLNETNSGQVFDFENREGVKNKLIRIYVAFKKGNLEQKSVNTDQFLRSNLTKQLSADLDEMCGIKDY
ncbi:glycosyltransferase family 4 protein [Reichenbachiella sp.]|uniref:glycosyltransferase family 4 protein n=1 Tax=Reichenbachiella sp. TaxID=2184521 RepID=UPI003B5BF0F5